MVVDMSEYTFSAWLTPENGCMTVGVLCVPYEGVLYTDTLKFDLDKMFSEVMVNLLFS